ncbi:MAG: PAS domain-containing sensor histidine kinase, partial [Rubrivivax sp.]|nr:PAS domain-containing sensor histidine kinase [Rubrivivax sp.]
MSKSARWAWVVSLVAATGAALVLAFVLSFSDQGGGFYERHFVWLFVVNVAVALLLMAVIAWVAVRLFLRLRQGKFGTRLLIKLAGIFAVVGLLPGLVIYTVSYQFATRSIEAWFDVRLAGALDAGLALGKTTLETLAADLVTKARAAASRLAETGSALQPLELERLREQVGASEAALIGPNGQLLASAGGSAATGPPARPAPALLRQARLLSAASQIDGLDEDALAVGGRDPLVRALVRMPRSAIALAGG